MTMYAPSDVRSISIPDGCGQPHEAGDLGGGGRMTLDCPPCEASLQVRPTMGWATHEAAVHLTPDEIGENERAEKTAQRVGTHLLASQILGAASAQQAQGVPQAMLEQFAAMQAQIEALTAKLADQAAPAAPAVPEPEPVAATPVEPAAPVKRAAKKAAPPASA